MYFLLKIVIFNCYVSLPKANPNKKQNKVCSERPFGGGVGQADAAAPQPSNLMVVYPQQMRNSFNKQAYTLEN